MRENKQDILIRRSRKILKNKNSQKLNSFLSNHPNLSWMQNIFEKKFDKVANTLKDLADVERDSVTRQKTMLSLCKLAKLAGNSANEDEFVDNINFRLELVTFQEDLPDYLLEQFGYDKNNPSVISPKDLISLYCCTKYSDATEMEFKKAIDLLEYIQDIETKNEMKLHVWTNAILRDKWSDKNLDSPIEVLKSKMFFKVADLAYSLGLYYVV